MITWLSLKTYVTLYWLQDIWSNMVEWDRCTGQPLSTKHYWPTCLLLLLQALVLKGVGLKNYDADVIVDILNQNKLSVLGVSENMLSEESLKRIVQAAIRHQGRYLVLDARRQENCNPNSRVSWVFGFLFFCCSDLIQSESGSRGLRCLLQAFLWPLSTAPGWLVRKRLSALGGQARIIRTSA